jgi:DNA-binding transcriptional ArsR family regulator
MSVDAYAKYIKSSHTQSVWRAILPDLSDLDAVYVAVARYFALLSDPMRLRIMHAVCHAERSVNEIVEQTGGTQTNVSRHLNLMHERGALARRKEGSLVYYSVADRALIEMCRTVCQRVSEEIDGAHGLKRGLKEVMEELK